MSGAEKVGPRLGSARSWLCRALGLDLFADSRYRRSITLLWGWSAAMLIVCAVTIPLHDYQRYLDMWRLFIDGESPWIPLNTYGPFHLIQGLFLPLGEQAPKIFVALLALLANFALVAELLRASDRQNLWVYRLAIPLNYLVIGVGFRFGLNDTFVAVFMIAAVLFRLRGRMVSVGLCLAAAALIKYYPLLLIPFFALDRGRISWKLAFSAGAFFFAILLSSYLYWGEEIFNGMRYGAEREPKLLSVFAALLSTFPQSGFLNSVIAANAYLVVAGTGLCFLLCWRLKAHWLVASVLGYLVMLLLYKVGHQQFFLPWLFLVVALPLARDDKADRLALAMLPVAIFLSIYHLAYDVLTDGFHGQTQWVRDFGGYGFFAVCLFGLLQWAKKNQKAV